MKNSHLKCIERIFVPILILHSCEKQENQSVEAIEPTDNDEYFVSSQDAENLISQVNFELFVGGDKSKGSSMSKGQKKIKKSKSFPDNFGKAAYHIIKFEEGGFVIISADKRTEALLAFSDTNDFNLDNVPLGPKGWLKTVSDGISRLRTDKKVKDKTNKFIGSWEVSEIENALANTKSKKFSKNIQSSGDCYYPGYPPGCSSPCQDTYYTKGPLLQTTWMQRTGFNNLLDFKNCSNTTNGRELTGCIAVAMGQVMNYHEEPDWKYDFSAMPNSSGSNETSKLLRDIGTTINMKYGCNNSWAYPWLMDDAFTAYGYGEAVYENYDPGDQNVVKSELNNNRPVLLEGKEVPLVSFDFDHTWHV